MQTCTSVSVCLTQTKDGTLKPCWPGPAPWVWVFLVALAVVAVVSSIVVGICWGVQRRRFPRPMKWRSTIPPALRTPNEAYASLVQNWMSTVRKMSSQALTSSQESTRLSPAGFVLPIVYSAADMAYVLPVQLGNSVLRLVIDTGSQRLCVATQACVETAACQIPDKQGYVASTKRRVLGASQQSYATLHMHGQFMEDSIRVIGPGKVLSDRVQFFAASAMEGFASNILGMARPVHPQAATLQEKLLQHGDNTWGLCLTSKGEGLMYVGRDAFPLLRHLPWIELPLNALAASHGTYIVPLVRIGIRRKATDSNRDIVWASQVKQKLELVIDTGTAETHFPDTIIQFLEKQHVPTGTGALKKNALASEQYGSLIFDIGTPKSSVLLEYSPQRYIVPFVTHDNRELQGLQRSTLHPYADGMHGILEDLQSSSQHAMILFGIAHMQNMAWEFPWRQHGKQGQKLRVASLSDQDLTRIQDLHEQSTLQAKSDT